MMQNCRKRKPTNKASPTFLMRACVHLCVCVLCVDWVMQFVCHLSLGVYGRSFFFHLASIGRNMFAKGVSQEIIHSFGVIY